MRLRLRRKKRKAEIAETSDASGREAKPAKPVRRSSIFRQFLDNPNLGTQLLVILMTLTSGNIQMDRRIDNMTASIDKIRNITELVNNTMNSLKTAAEVPNQVRRLLK